MQYVLIALSAIVAVAMAGKCSRDGFFYNDDKSFTICSNGNSYVQPCAPGARNSGKYKHGGYALSAHAFCDVNLVDHGYALKHGYHGHGHHNNHHGGYGHGHHGNSYGHHGSHGNGHNNYGYGHHGNHGGYGNHGNYGYGNFGHHGGYNSHHGHNGHHGGY